MLHVAREKRGSLGDKVTWLCHSIDAVNCVWALTLACPRVHSECAVFSLRPGEEDDTECLLDYLSIQDRTTNTRVSPTSNHVQNLWCTTTWLCLSGSPTFLVQHWKAGWNLGKRLAYTAIAHRKKWGVPYAPWGAPQPQLLKNVFDLFNKCDCTAPQGCCGTLYTVSFILNTQPRQYTTTLFTLELKVVESSRGELWQCRYQIEAQGS